MWRTAEFLVALYCLTLAIVFFAQRRLLYFPSHRPRASALSPWSEGAEVIGFCREVAAPRTVWLMLHGNAGQALGRDYVLPRMSPDDSLYVLEYPGYGMRPGSPSLSSINEAAVRAYRRLRQQHPRVPVGVVGESIGSGPACVLAAEPTPPDKIILIVPFDVLASVAAEHLPWLPARRMLRDRWDNAKELRGYPGPVEIYGARDDEIIPVRHAKALASQAVNAQFKEFPGGHNDWSGSEKVRIAR